jgi:hypothetical protein
MIATRLLPHARQLVASVLLLAVCAALLQAVVPSALADSFSASGNTLPAASCPDGSGCADGSAAGDGCGPLSCAHCGCHLFLAAGCGPVLDGPASRASLADAPGQEYESFLPPPVLPPPAAC